MRKNAAAIRERTRAVLVHIYLYIRARGIVLIVNGDKCKCMVTARLVVLIYGRAVDIETI